VWRQDRRVGFVTCRLVGFDCFLHVQAWVNRGLARPAVRRGLEVRGA
jgi:GST-like protein